MREKGYDMQYDGDKILVAYVVGPLFFGSVNVFNTELEKLNGVKDIILSLRTVPLLDTTGVSAIEELVERVEHNGGRVYLCGLTDPVRSYLERAGLIKHLGEDHIFWSSYEAIMAADHYRAQQAGTVPVAAGEMTTV
jgi:SulP family sulfate permease